MVADLRGGVVNRNTRNRTIETRYPVGEVAGIHFLSRNVRGKACCARTVAERFVGGKHEGLVPAVVDFGNPDGTTNAAAEIVLFIDRDGEAGPVVEEVVRVKGVVAEELVDGAPILVGTAF